MRSGSKVDLDRRRTRLAGEQRTAARWPWPRAAGAVAVLALTGCASAPGAGAPAAGPPDPAVERAVIEATAIDSLLHVIFAWNLIDADNARFSGEGVTRYQPPDRARLDLFGPRGGTYLQAAVVGAELRLPPDKQDAPLPPPALLWGVLGLIRPPQDAQLVGTAVDGGRTRLDYARGDDRWTFLVTDGRLDSIEWVSSDGGRRTVRLQGSGDAGLPAEAVYRDWRGHVELRLNLKEAWTEDEFPPDIWTIGRGSGSNGR